MNYLFILIGLRAAAISLAAGGRVRAAEHVHLLADAISAGRLVEADLQLVADKLASREITDADFDDVVARIQADSARLQE